MYWCDGHISFKKMSFTFPEVKSMTLPYHKAKVDDVLPIVQLVTKRPPPVAITHVDEHIAFHEVSDVCGGGWVWVQMCELRWCGERCRLDGPELSIHMYMCVYKCVYMCVYTCVHVCLHVCLQVCLQVFTCVYMCVYECVYMCLRVCLHVCMFV